jgi:dihydrolipoamide dehydrogenase
MADSYDCIVIGSGPGGYVAAIRAAQLGFRTAVVEKDDVVGGRCLNYACIPAKAVLRTADVLSEIREADDFGIKVKDPKVDFAGVTARRDKVIKTLTGGVAGLFKKNSIEVINGHGAVTADGNVKVGGDFDGRELEAKVLVLATGSVAKPVPGTQFGGRVIDTAGAWLMSELPASIAVIGAGASGTEIASAYARLGTETTLFEALDRVLPTEDADISKLAERGFKKQGITVHTGTLVQDVTPGDGSVTFTYGDGQSGEAEYLCIATGRGPDEEGLGLAEAGIELDENGLVKVDGAMRTSRPGVYAIGDLVHGPALAHKASDEGVIAVEDAAGLDTHPISYIDVPRATFCMPNVASFGLTEAEAREQGHDVDVVKHPLSAVTRAQFSTSRRGLYKIVFDRTTRRVLGIHVVSRGASDIVGGLAVSLNLGARVDDLALVHHVYPSYSEGVKAAAEQALTKAVAA